MGRDLKGWLLFYLYLTVSVMLLQTTQSLQQAEGCEAD
jgi:hypothetical protein